jgi:hypothetical protein
MHIPVPSPGKPKLRRKESMTKKLAPKKAFRPAPNSLPRGPIEATDISNHEPEPKKTATILYKHLPEKMILITGFRNFLTKVEMVEKFGSTVAIAYEAYPCHMFAHVRVRAILPEPFTYVEISDDEEDLEINMVLSNRDFGRLYSKVKKCGELLHKIRISLKENPIKALTI